jgi:hypothetical protein
MPRGSKTAPVAPAGGKGSDVPKSSDSASNSRPATREAMRTVSAAGSAVSRDVRTPATSSSRDIGEDDPIIEKR